jgi:hypothetical protein
MQAHVFAIEWPRRHRLFQQKSSRRYQMQFGHEQHLRQWHLQSNFRNFVIFLDSSKVDLFVHSNDQKAGCDNVLNSSTEFDNCGICGGDNSKCKLVEHHIHPPSNYGMPRVHVFFFLFIFIQRKIVFYSKQSR